MLDRGPMTAQNEAYLILDTAYLNGIVAIINKDRVIFSQILRTQYAHGQDLAPTIKNAIEKANEQGLKIAGVFCGLGPGSFIGVRIALSLALGFTFARGLPLMGFCSLKALTYSTDYYNRSISMAMKASLDQFYFNEYQDGVPLLPSPMVLNIGELAKNNKNQTIYTDQHQSLSQYCFMVDIKEILGPTEKGLHQILLAKLKQGITDESMHIKPNYVKVPSIFIVKPPVSR
jgi:tRNA threonylcarbamoyl adenosine modification protein YeaZ